MFLQLASVLTHTLPLPHFPLRDIKDKLKRHLDYDEIMNYYLYDLELLSGPTH